MSVESVRRSIRDLEVSALTEQVASDLNVRSPRLGASGPPSHAGPEDEYLAAIQRLRDDPSDFDCIGTACNRILLQEVLHATGEKSIARPLLLFNLGTLLQAARLPKVIGGLRELREGREVRESLRASLQGERENLYVHLLLAHAVNQDGQADVRFWLRLLESSDPKEVNAGVIGLRESGLDNACNYLPLVEEKFRWHPELGRFETEVMLLIDTYPDRPWPSCAQEFFPGSGTSEIPQLIRKHAADRYVPTVGDLKGVPRSAVDIVQGAGLAEEAERNRQQWPRSPAQAMLVSVLATEPRGESLRDFFVGMGRGKCSQ
jgi:hypothetical protein